MNKHTPGPWHYFRASWGGYVVDSPNKNIADIHAYLTSPEEQEANARFIVRACNAHDGLVEALETIAAAHTTDEFAFRCASAALALAKEGEA